MQIYSVLNLQPVLLSKKVIAATFCAHLKRVDPHSHSIIHIKTMIQRLLSPSDTRTQLFLSQDSM